MKLHTISGLRRVDNSRRDIKSFTLCCRGADGQRAASTYFGHSAHATIFAIGSMLSRAIFLVITNDYTSSLSGRNFHASGRFRAADVITPFTLARMRRPRALFLCLMRYYFRRR